jgi:hypothetical protein
VKIDQEMLEAARRAVLNPKPPSIVALDAAALRSATDAPVIVDLSQIVGFLSGANQNANQAGSYYSGAYGNAENQLVNSTGSPAAKTFGNLQQAALQPMFNQQTQSLADKEAAMGITHSGAANSDFSQLAAGQSGVLSGALAPLYSQALGQYGNLLSGGAAGQAGAQTGAYGQSINDFYSAVSDAAGVPSTPQSSTPGVGAGGAGGGYGFGNAPTGVQPNTSSTPAYGNFGNVYAGG